MTILEQIQGYWINKCLDLKNQLEVCVELSSGTKAKKQKELELEYTKAKKVLEDSFTGTIQVENKIIN